MDTILAELIKKYEQRSEAGIEKYGTTLDRMIYFYAIG